MLDRQYHMYAVDTGHFYSNREKYLHDMYCRYRREYRQLQSAPAERKDKSQQPESAQPDSQRLQDLLAHKRAKSKEAKEKLLTLLSNKTAQNKKTSGKDHTRRLREDALSPANVISVFDSALSRAVGIGPDELADTLITVQVYYFSVFEDLIYNGFTYQGETYRYFTSSAGQIRNKKAVFIKKTVWATVEKTIMCGLSVDRINEKGGNNVNKYLAYMALNNSATDPWTQFDIDKTLVLDDFETKVYGVFDFVDETDYTIARKKDYVPISHTDGAGMILPSLSTRNFMIRAPWIKGLLGVFDFRKFIEEKGLSPLVKDIYGTQHDILKEDIQIIFTKSQFKMHAYYDSWDEYKACFKKYRCGAGICNVEETRIKNAKLNYQMLQTLTDVSEEEIDLLTRKSAERIQNICTSCDTMLDTLGATAYNADPNPFQKSLLLYPALLNDTYVKDMLREVKDSLVKKYRSGKLEITGKYTFLLPDYYAACEYWFGHNENPAGLLADGEVFCRLFPTHAKLDCLRSPHLFREHGIRNNVAALADHKNNAPAKKWFLTNGLYTSSHDLVSKLLQFDVDGDKALVVADPDFIRIAERNMRNVVPLYYNMRKAAPAVLGPQSIYAGLIQAFTTGNIGLYSNDISKIWNHEVFLSGSASQKQEATDIVKRLCMENNFCIDAAKTLYMPKRPAWFSQAVSKYANAKLPAFFAYAKDKTQAQLEKRNQSLVNKLYDKIPNIPINTRNLRLDTIDYRHLMANKQLRCHPSVATLYDKLNKEYRYMLRIKDGQADNLRYIAGQIRLEFGRLGYTDQTVADMLAEYLYGGQKRSKQLLWFCYGQFLYQNLKNSLGTPKRTSVRCADCGAWMQVNLRDHETKRCPDCYLIYRKKYKAQKERERRQMKKCVDNTKPPEKKRD